MIPDLGGACLVTAMVLCWALTLFYAMIQGKDWAGNRGIVCLPQAFISFLCLTAFACLLWSFATSDFSLKVVAMHGHSAMPWVYRLGATWGHHEGSMLLFATIFSFFAWGFSSRVAYAWHCLLLGCLLAYILFYSNPFELLQVPMSQGQELNPLLQDALLMIHPPLLYIGYGAVSVPFCITLETIFKKGPFDAKQISRLRQYTLFSWAFLSVGVALGSFWAYYELGWGGWWFWDPVENVALIPWLFLTVLIHLFHGVRHQPSWLQGVVACVLLSMVSVYFSFALVRSGGLSSVHSFAFDPNRAWGLGALTLSVSLLSLVAWFTFQKTHAAQQPMTLSLWDRRFYYSVGIALWLMAAAVIVLGVSYPLLADVFSWPSVTVGAPYYHQTVVPMGLGSLIPMAMVLSFAWKPLGKAILWQRLQKLFLAAMLFLLLVGYGGQGRHWTHGVGLFLALWVLSSVVIRQTKWPLRLAHGGFALCLLGMCLDLSLYKEETMALSPGETRIFQGYDVSFDHITRGNRMTHTFEQAAIRLTSGSRHYALFPEKRFYPSHEMLTTETALLWQGLSHIHVMLGGMLHDGRRTFRISHHPWVTLIWLGALLMALGAGLKILRLREKEKGGQK